MAEKEDLSKDELDVFEPLGETQRTALLQNLESGQLKKWISDKKKHIALVAEVTTLKGLYDKALTSEKKDSWLILDARKALKEVSTEMDELGVKLSSVAGFESTQIDRNNTAEDRAKKVGSEAILTDSKYRENDTDRKGNTEHLKDTSKEFSVNKTDMDATDEKVDKISADEKEQLEKLK